VFANYDDRTPQIEYEVDREKVKSLGVSLSDLFFTLQTFMGGYYVNDFNLFRPDFQGAGASRGEMHGQNRKTLTATTCAASMATWCRSGQVLKPVTINGPEFFERYNIYRAAQSTGFPHPVSAPGRPPRPWKRWPGRCPMAIGYE